MAGEAGAGGIIFDPGGEKVTTYEWGLGRKTNNEAEMDFASLWDGTSHAKQDHQSHSHGRLHTSHPQNYLWLNQRSSQNSKGL